MEYVAVWRHVREEAVAEEEGLTGDKSEVWGGEEMGGGVGFGEGDEGGGRLLIRVLWWGWEMRGLGWKWVAGWGGR